MTAVNIVQHAAGVRTEVKGTGMLGFIKYDSRPVSIFVTLGLLAGAVSVATSGSTPYTSI
eukprot:CAMPEP_0115864742 /NCGR_PEP_ID=MMETSP0287-20121206/19357_1 /TAXON_ID=412157 /ORGANISM="Chrysochromulina rotalis, Strain UIO044" /LENGTH=59 /DNA_ID=CAMNT_0003319221 /DNA_START=360 /DNA_END=539 /DNA_ORIENTATION=+